MLMRAAIIAMAVLLPATVSAQARFNPPVADRYDALWHPTPTRILTGS